jgi:protein O-mannosyl-transferase
VKPMVVPIPRGLPWGAVMAAVALCAAIAAVYVPGLDAPFFMDDVESVAQSRSIRALPNLRDVLLYPNTNGKTVDGRPFLNLSLAINYSISGASPASFRVGNVVIHCLNAVILAALLARLFASPSLPVIVRSHGRECALVAAALWSLHPLCTGAVTYIIQRAESLAAGLMLLAALALFTGMTQSLVASRRWLWFATAMLAALGGLTKEIAVVLPLATIAIDRALVAGSWRATLAHWRWHLAAAAAWPTIAVAALVLGGRGSSAGVLAGTSPWRYLLTQATAVGIYAGRILWPRGLVFDYGTPLSSGLAESWLPLVLAGVAVGAVALGYFFRPVRYLAPALFFLLLAPTTSIVPVKTQTIAEHRLYLPLAPVAAAVAASIAMTAARLGAPVGWPRGAALALAAALAAGTVARNLDYRSAETIWRQSLAANPANDRAAFSLAQALLERGDAPAIAEAARLMAETPSSGWYAREEAVTCRMIALAQGRLDDALLAAEAQVSAAPERADGLAARGYVRWKRGEFPLALGDLEESLRRNPDDASAWTNLGNVLIDVGQLSDAEQVFRRAIGADSTNAAAWSHLGIVLAMRGATGPALAALDRAVEHDPRSARVRNNRGNVRHAAGDLAGSRADYDAAVRLEPWLADSYLSRCQLHLLQGDEVAARADLEAFIARGGRPPQAVVERLQEKQGLVPRSPR